MLMLMSLRARFSDLHPCESFDLEGDKVIATVKETKTSRRFNNRLPVKFFGLRLLTTGQDWIS
eukprot:12106847-Karenia_brevis.AAC.1